jgi:hypothetical protein
MNLAAFNLKPSQEADFVKVLTDRRALKAWQVRKHRVIDSLAKQDKAKRTLVESHGEAKGWKVHGAIIDAGKSDKTLLRLELIELRAAARGCDPISDGAPSGCHGRKSP